MTARGGIPQTTMRFMPLADIFIGAIACLLILIIVARQARETTTRIPQADLVLACAAEATTAGEPSFAVLAGAGESRPHHFANLKKLEAFLRQAKHENRLTYRLLLQVPVQSMRTCRRRVFFLIRRLNRQYENPDAKQRPASYLLLDTNVTTRIKPNEKTDEPHSRT